MRWLLCVAVLTVAGMTSAWAAQGARGPQTLLQAWLAFPRADQVAWPYAYIRTPAVVASEKRHKQQVLAELEHLLWRLGGQRYAPLRHTVQRFQAVLQAKRAFRLPGDWSPAWLLSHPHRRPPLKRVDALGACHVPHWVEIWDGNGVHRIAWASGMTLSRLLFEDNAIAGGGRPRVAIVRPRGAVEHLGIQGWNFADTGISPGTRIVAALPLQGQAFPWIRDAIARLLAHTPTGDACRQFRLNGSAADE